MNEWRALRPQRVALVTPLSVAGVEGGNERLWRSLCAALIDAGHDARLVAEVSPEADLLEVLGSYARFHALDLSDADLVISGKYPSYMVRHPRHLRYLIHPLRGLYEHYPAHLTSTLDPDLADGIDAWGDDVDGLIGWAEEAARVNIDDPTFAFPGPFARAVVRRLDRIGRDRLTAEATMSETVANRQDYLDPSRAISIIPPLGDLSIGSTPDKPDEADEAERRFLFTFGRLDRAKRFDLILQSFEMARRLPGMADAELVVAGSGPMAAELASLAGPRTSLVGRIDDDSLVDHLRRACAVVLTPIDEDFGLVAAEAMAAGTPVITTTDSGGVAEQIAPGRTGLVVPPRRPLLAKAMRDLVVDRERAARMGRAAGDAVAGSSWDPMLSLIDELGSGASHATARRRILLVSTFPADPVVSGGQRRLRGMAAGLAGQGWLPTVLSLTNRLGPDQIRRRRTPDGVRHVMVGRSARHLRADFAMSALLGTPIDDVACAELWTTSKAFAPELRTQIAAADVVVLSHPFLVGAVAEASAHLGNDTPVVYDAFNVETDLKRDLFAPREGGNWVADRAAATEATALTMARIVSATCAADLERLKDIGATAIDGVVMPNPIDPSLLEPRDDEERQRARARFLLDLGATDDRPIVLFVGSDHPPNRSAARRCAELAAARPDLHVVIAGGVRVGPVDGVHQPTIVGPFVTADLRRLHVMADVVINPVTDGSGTSLKMIDPLALGVPVVSTPTGARGLDDAGGAVWTTEPDPAALGAAIDRCLTDGTERDRRVAIGLDAARRAHPLHAVAPLVSHLDQITPRPMDS